MEAIHQQIKKWREGLLAPHQNDVLLTLTPHKNAFPIDEKYREEDPFILQENPLLSKFYKQHRQHIKETGSPIFGIAQDKITFELDGKVYKMPFLLASADIKKNRFNSTFIIQQIEDFYIHPLLFQILQLESISMDIEEAKDQLKTHGLAVEIENGIWAANFHPHRFVLQKEFDELLEVPKLNPSLKSLFGEVSHSPAIVLSNHYLFPADASQKKAIEKVKNHNLVIQGPPGTGKSQVIANLIGKILGTGKNTLLVAEKSVALQVIYDQLKKKGLEYFCVLYHHELKSKHFVRSLKRTWKFLDTLPKNYISVGEQSEMLQQGLDFTLERLRQKDLIGGVAFSTFKSEFTLDNKVVYLSQKPTLPEWNKKKVLLEQLQQNHFPLYGSWLNLNTQKHSIQEIESGIQKTLRLLKKLPNSILTPKELQNNMKLSGLVALFYYNDQSLPIQLFEENSKIQKLFLTHYQKIKILREKEELLKEEEKHWKKNFSLSELEEYIKVLSNTNRFNIHSYLTRKKLSKFTDLNMVDGKKALENLMELTTIKRALISTKEKLIKQNIPDEIAVLNHIHFAINRINSVDKNDVQALFQMTPKERLEIKNQVQIFTEIHQNLRAFFHLQEEKPIQEQIKALDEILPLLVENSARIDQIDPQVKLALRLTKNLKETETAIFNSHWKDFKGQFPELSATKGKDIISKVEKIIATFDKEADAFALSIQQEIKSKFEAYHTLLQTPARKLSEDEKSFKKALRKGKSILVKAFDKKRVFPSVRELLEGDARHWIQLLHPVFLCSPYSVAKSLPIDYTFELGIFDEASQIPLSHVIGSVQRSKRVVISGDQQQMAPQFYFQKKELQQSDALHHASFYWENTLLTHHYRSKYPQLIGYSNQYFYDNQLKTFPVSKIQENPIELITTDGNFINRKNEKEATLVAKILIQKIRNKDFNFGLVAFSQTQLNAILEQIPSKYLDQLAEKDTVFVQSLENVQGDQCEHLIISLGYAKNENGDFHMRFGPLNQEQGHRRLNVLMSRAIAKITFVRSVTSENFTISDNEGVEMLRKLMLFLENVQQNDLTFNFPLSIQEKHQQLSITDLASTFKNAQEVVDFYRTSTNRGWKVEIDL